MDKELRIERIGILTLKIDPTMLGDPNRWLMIKPAEETLVGLKKCDRFEIEIIPISLIEELSDTTPSDKSLQNGDGQ